MAKCLICKKETVDKTKGRFPVHRACRPNLQKYKEKLINKTAKEVHEKMEGVEMFSDFDEILANARKTINIHDTLKALDRGDLNEN